jgi:tetratricopeptide (TPR) repeat protein
MRTRGVSIVMSGLLLITLLTADRLRVRPAILQGNAAFRNGNAAAAEAQYAEALRREPDSGTVTFNVGTVAYDRRLYAKAAEDFDKASRRLSIGSEQARAYYNRGEALFQLGNLAASREAFKSALRLDSSDEDARYNFVLVDQLLRGLDRNGADRSDTKPLTRDRAEQMLDSLGPTMRRSRTVPRLGSPGPQPAGVVDK